MVVACHNVIIASVVALCIYGCGFPSDSYEKDHDNDWEIVRAIIKANPVLESAMDSGHHFLPTSAETSRTTGFLNLMGLGLNDSNFYFPKNIRNFKRVNVLSLAGNSFTDLPRGIQQKSWERVDVWRNSICYPSLETIAYLDEITKGSLGGYWRDSQNCGDSDSTTTP